jgi:hypothetical protein
LGDNFRAFASHCFKSGDIPEKRKSLSCMDSQRYAHGEIERYLHAVGRILFVTHEPRDQNRLNFM